MKKFMMFLIGLIPLVLIFTIQITTIFIEKSQYIAVERVTFEQNYQVITKSTSDNVTISFPAKISPISATNKEIVYSSSDETIATVNNSGEITFYDFGNVTITAKSKATESIFDVCTFFITDNKVHKVTIVNKTDSLVLGNYFYLNTTVAPVEAYNKSLTYISTNPDAVTVMPDGKVTAVGEGESTIIAQTANGVFDSFITKTIIPVTGIKIDNNFSITGVASSKFPTVEVLPNNATNKSVVYSSSNIDVATIDEQGNILFSTSGEVTFTATSVYDTKFSVDYRVRYTGGYFVSMEVNKDFKTINLTYEPNKIIDLKLDVIPTNADYKNVRYVSSNENVVSVVDGKLVVTGGGVAVISVFANTGNGEISSSANIYVTRDAQQIVATDFSTNTAVCDVPYQVVPTDHTNTVAFASGSDLATINSDGQITFNAPGSVVITISTNNNISKQIVVTYQPKNTNIKNITKSNQTLSINYQDEFNISFDVSLNLGKPQYLGYDTSLLSFNSSTNLFTAIDGGSTTIVAKDSNGNKININVEIYRKATQINYSLTNPNNSNNLVLENNQYITGLKKIKLSTSVLPSTATIKTPTIAIQDYKGEISETSISEPTAFVNDNSEIEFNKAGIVLVTLTVDDVYNSFVLSSTFGEVKKVTIDNNFKTINLTYNEEENYFVNFNYSIYPIDANKDNVVLSVVSGSAVTIKNNKILVKCGGTATVKVAGSYSGSEDTLVLNITQNVDEIMVKNNSSVVNINQYHYQIDFSISPSTHTNTITLTTDSTIASVSQSGYVSFNAPGNVVVTINSSNGVSNQIEILYTPASVVKTITSNNQDVEVNYLEKFAFIYDSNVGMGVPQYSGFDTSVVVYDETTQTFSAVQGGQTQITVTSTEVEILINLRVIKKATDIEFKLYEFDNLENVLLTHSSTNYLVTTALTKFVLQSNTLDAYATIKTPTCTLDSQYSDIAQYSDGTIEFKQAGTIVLKLTADDITKTITIRSTYGYVISITALQKTLQYNYDELENKTISVTYSVYPSDANLSYVSFESSNESAVKVEDGKLVVVGGGETEITIKAKINSTDYVTDIVSASVTQKATNVQILNSENGQINITNYQYSVQSVSYPSTNTDGVNYSLSSTIASVDTNGNVCFSAPGSVVLTVTKNKNVSDSVVINYIPENFNKVVVSDNNYTLNVNYGDNFGLIFDHVLCFGVPNYTGFDTNILQYNPTTFKFVALMGGTTTITAQDGNTDITIVVNVYRSVDSITTKVVYVDSQTSPNTDANLTYVTAHTQLQLNTTISPSDATIQTPTYTVLSGSATVDKNGKVVFSQYGTSEIKIEADGKYTTIKLKSTCNRPESFEIYNVVVNSDSTKPSLILENLQDTYTLSLCSFSPLDYTFDISHVIFKSLNTNVATINNNGVITAVGKGLATIMVEFQLSDTLTVNKQFVVEVQVKTTGVNFVFNGNKITEGSIINNSITLNYELLPNSPNEPNNQNVKIEVNNAVATISNIDENKKTFVLTFNSDATSNVAYVTISTQDSNYEIKQELVITKVSNVDYIVVKQGDVTVSGTTIYSEYTTSEQIVSVTVTASGLLDQPDISNLVASSSNSNNVVVQEIKTNGLSTGTFRISKVENLNKTVTETITFGYNSTTTEVVSQVTFKFYDIAIELDITKENHLLGLQRKHVFGTNRYYTTDGTNYTSDSKLPVQFTKSSSQNTDTLYWQTSNSSVATVSTNANGEVFLNFNPSNVSSETTLTLFASLEPLTANGANYDSILNSVKSKFTYNIVNGYNIYDDYGYNYCIKNSLPIVMQNNITPDFTKQRDLYNISTEIKTTGLVNKKYHYYYSLSSFNAINKMVYGNGYTLSYENWVDIFTLNPTIDGNTYTMQDDDKKEDHDLHIYGGFTNLVFKASKDSLEKTNFYIIPCINNITVSYSRLQNYKKIWVGWEGCNTYFKNCIFENSLQSGIQMGKNDNGDNSKYNLYLENTLFFENGQLAVEQQVGTVYIKGIFDIYNFAMPSEFNTGTLGTLVQSAIKSAYNDYDSSLIYTDDSGNKYANTGIGLIGTSVDTSKKVYFDNGDGNGYVMYNFDAENASDIVSNSKHNLQLIKGGASIYKAYILARPTQGIELNQLPESAINKIYAPLS